MAFQGYLLRPADSQPFSSKSISVSSTLEAIDDASLRGDLVGLMVPLLEVHIISYQLVNMAVTFDISSSVIGLLR